MRNRGKEWSRDELILLGQMIRDKVHMRHIRTILGRSESAILHALRNSMYFQLLDYDPSYVAERYHTTPEHLASGIVPVKYNVPLPSTVSSCDETTDTDADASSEPRVDGLCHALLAMFCGMLIGGMAYYARVLDCQWGALTLPS